MILFSRPLNSKDTYQPQPPHTCSDSHRTLPTTVLLNHIELPRESWIPRACYVRNTNSNVGRSPPTKVGILPIIFLPTKTHKSGNTSISLFVSISLLSISLSLSICLVLIKQRWVSLGCLGVLLPAGRVCLAEGRR